MQVSEGYVAVHGLGEGTKVTTRSEWRARIHPEDLDRVEVSKPGLSRTREANMASSIGSFAANERFAGSKLEVLSSIATMAVRSGSWVSILTSPSANKPKNTETS